MIQELVPITHQKFFHQLDLLLGFLTFATLLTELNNSIFFENARRKEIQKLAERMAQSEKSLKINLIS